jgi:hypothetical protein
MGEDHRFGVVWTLACQNVVVDGALLERARDGFGIERSWAIGKRAVDRSNVPNVCSDARVRWLTCIFPLERQTAKIHAAAGVSPAARIFALEEYRIARSDRGDDEMKE